MLAICPPYRMHGRQRPYTLSAPQPAPYLNSGILRRAGTALRGVLVFVGGW